MSWIPHPGAQTEFLSRSEFEVLFGGAAGPGKTDCLVAGLTRDVANPRYRGLLLRRTYPQLQEIIDRCWRLYARMGATYRATEKRWAFPSGAVIDLGHMQHEDDKYNYQGKEYHRAGVDELTQFTETQYTYLISRLRTTDPEIIPQILSTTNPGGIGHYWVKERFVTITDHGRTYFDPKTGLSRVFIPAKIEDNPTLFESDPAYLQRLEALPEIERQRLRHGVWDAFEGQVFTELSQRLHGCEDFEIPPEWERFCVLDWGFSKPFSVGWYALDYDGILYRYREWYGCKKEIEAVADGADVGLKLQAWEVGKGILDREKGERIRMRIADPSIWHPRPEKRRREAHGITIHEDMTTQGVYFIKADNDRVHGKMQVHKRLKVESDVDPETGEVLDERPLIKIFNSCKGFWRTMPLLREDPRNTEDVDCWVAGTLVATPDGPRPIEKIAAGELVDTPIGPRRVLRSYVSGLSRTVQARLADGRVIEGTPHHKVYVRGKGLVPLESLECHDILIERNMSWLARKLLFIAAFAIRAIQGVCITTLMGLCLAKAEIACTVRFGLTLAARFLRVGTSIMSTMIMTTTDWRTLRVCHRASMVGSTSKNGCAGIWANAYANGEPLNPAGKSFVTMLERCGRELRRGQLRAGIVNALLLRDIPQRLFVLPLVKSGPISTKLKRHVLSVAPAFVQSAIQKRKLRLARIAAVGHCAERSQVYNLTVEKAHLFYANGILSSNTDQEDHIYDEFRYMCMARPVRPKKVDRAPAGSFQAERSRLIRAKQYARRHGISVDVAYSRTR